MSSTKINLNQLDGNVYTQDNLVAGNNITLEDKVIEPVDEYTQMLVHFNDSVEDVSPNHFTPTNTNWQATYVPGKFGKAFSNYTVAPASYSDMIRLRKANQSEYIDISETGMTMEYWYYVDYDNTQGGDSFIALQGFEDSFTIQPQALGNNIFNGFAISAGPIENISISKADAQLYLINEDWNHICMTYSPGEYIKVYLNGHLAKNIPSSQFPSTFENKIREMLLSTGLTTNLFLIDEFRASNCIRYNEDTFTVPTQPFSVPKTVKAINSSNSVQSTNISNIVTLTQVEYDTLTTKDPNTFYVIVEDSDESL